MPVEWELLLLILIANGTPIMAAALCGPWGAYPLDGGCKLGARRVLGDSKTWRGIILALLVTSVVAPLFGLSLDVGSLVGVGAMLGDVLSSFIKRRLGMVSSSMALGLDQIPEALLPLLLVADRLQLTGWVIAWTVAAFIIIELAISPLFFRLGIRDRPY
jgi:CDP-2,3-bis-(O-geranylgeranyl)-sn-glycerol synthase